MNSHRKPRRNVLRVFDVCSEIQCDSKSYFGFVVDKFSELRQAIGHVRYINIQAWLRGFRVKIANFSSFFCPSIPIRDLHTKETTPNMEVWPKSLGAMLEYWYIERGLLWNGLKSQIRNEPNFNRFKGLLKTHYY